MWNFSVKGAGLLKRGDNYKIEKNIAFGLTLFDIFFK